MAAHDWTRSRQRSVRGGAPADGPPPTPPSGPPPEVESASDADPGADEIADLESGEPAESAEVETADAATQSDAEPAPGDQESIAAGDDTLDPAPVDIVDTGGHDSQAPGPVADVQAASPANPTELDTPTSGPGQDQATLPLGLEPLPERPPKRTATETREDLIQRLLDPHLTLQETAKLLDVCPTTVRRYTNRGLLAHYRTPGNQRRFRLSDVLGFMERQGIPALGLERKRAEAVKDTDLEDENAI